MGLKESRQELEQNVFQPDTLNPHGINEPFRFD